MDIRTTSLYFQFSRGSGPKTAEKSEVFPREVERAVAGIAGYSAGFSRDKDHELGILQVQLATTVIGNIVTVTGTFGLRDWCGNSRGTGSRHGPSE